jgi:hypothetical protein
VGGSGKVRKRLAEGAWVGSLEEHKRHAGSEEDDIGGLVLGKEFVFQVSKASKHQRWVRGFVE